MKLDHLNREYKKLLISFINQMKEYKLEKIKKHRKGKFYFYSCNKSYGLSYVLTLSPTIYNYKPSWKINLKTYVFDKPIIGNGKKKYTGEWLFKWDWYDNIWVYG